MSDRSGIHLLCDGVIVPCGVALGRVTATATSDVEANTNGIVVLYTDVSAFVNGAAAELLTPKRLMASQVSFSLHPLPRLHDFPHFQLARV